MKKVEKMIGVRDSTKTREEKLLSMGGRGRREERRDEKECIN